MGFRRESHWWSFSISEVLGLDIHKKFLLAAVIDQAGNIEEHWFNRTQGGLFMLRIGLPIGCEVVARESTSDYWMQVYDPFAGQVLVIFENARDIKAISHKKTDKVDAV